MRVAIGSDKSGFVLKEALKAFLASDEMKAAGIDFVPERDDLTMFILITEWREMLRRACFRANTTARYSSAARARE